MSMTSAEQALQAMLSVCTGIQTFLGAVDGTEALTRIYRGAIPDPAGESYTEAELETIYPCCIVSTEEYNARHTSTSYYNEYLPSGMLRLQMCHFDNLAITEAEAYASDITKWDAVNELWGNTGPGTLDITEIRLVGFGRTRHSELAKSGNQSNDAPYLSAPLVDSEWQVVWGSGDV